MRVEKYIADDMRQAMAKVRDKLGRDALILSNRRVNGMTEIIAAVEDGDALESPGNVVGIDAVSKTGSKRNTSESKALATRSKGRKMDPDPLLSDIKSELGRLRNMFEGELSQLSWRELNDKQPNRLAIQNRLESAGLSFYVSNKIAEKVMPCNDLDQAWKNSLKMSARLTQFTEKNPIEEGGVIALLGSTGIGKTTTAAKIAAQFAERHGTNNVALISADNSRIGGKEQLLSFGTSMGIPVQFVSNNRELHTTLTSLTHKKLIIIDTAGVNQRSLDISRLLNALKQKVKRIDNYLVLSATAQEAVNNEVIEAFSQVNPTGAIITRCDECSKLGPVMSSLIRHQLPLAYISNGSKVPDDLMRADDKYLIANLVKNYRESLKSPSEKIPSLTLGSAVNA